MDLTELDTLRADTMRGLLNEKGRQFIWQYDIMQRETAFREALGDWNFDNIQIDGDSHKPYVLVGYGICDCPFETPEELVSLINWLCGPTGYLGCYATEAPA